MSAKFTLENLRKVHSIVFYVDRGPVSFLITHSGGNIMEMGQNSDYDKADCDSGSHYLVVELLEVITGSKFKRVRDEENLLIYRRE